MATVLGATKCSCSGTVTWTESKTGGASGMCSDCGEQRFKRTPKAVEALKRELASQAAPPAPAKPGIFGEPLDLTKLP